MNRMEIQDGFDTWQEHVLTIITLMNSDDPALDRIEIGEQAYPSEQLSESLQDSRKATDFASRMRSADKLVYHGKSSVLHEISLTFEKGQKPVLNYDGTPEEAEEFVFQLIKAVGMVFPDVNQLYSATVHFGSGSLIINQKVVLDDRMTWDDFQKTRLYRDVLPPVSKEKVNIGRPVSLFGREWVISLHFANHLSLISMRLIMPGKNGQAHYQNLDAGEMSLGFDQACALLNHASGQEGFRQNLNGMVCYGYEKLNMMVVQDRQDACVCFVMMYGKDDA